MGGASGTHLGRMAWQRVQDRKITPSVRNLVPYKPMRNQKLVRVWLVDPCRQCPIRSMAETDNKNCIHLLRRKTYWNLRRPALRSCCFVYESLNGDTL